MKRGGQPPLYPHHISLKSKCRGTSPGRSGSVAQRLGRQAVTALGHSPACLAWPPPPHPSPPRLARAYGSQAADPQWTSQSPAQLSPIPEPRNSSSTHWERGPVGLCVWGWGGGTSSAAPRPLDGGPAESATIDNPHLNHRAVLPSGPFTGPHIPMATVAGLSTQCEWATGQVLPNWDEGETFWESAHS